MKYLKYLITVLVLPFVMVFGILLFLDSLVVENYYSDHIASLINNGIKILAFLISIISTIVFILLNEILKELRKLNDSKSDDSKKTANVKEISNNEN